MSPLRLPKREPRQSGSSFLSTPSEGTQRKLPKISIPKIPFSKKWFLGILVFFVTVFVVVTTVGYFVFARPLLALAKDAKALKNSTFQIKQGMADQNFTEISSGLEATKSQLVTFRSQYENRMKLIRKLPKAEPYYQDGLHLIAAADQSIALGDLAITIMKPYANDIGFTTNGQKPQNIPAQERVIKILGLMPQFSKEVQEISKRVSAIDAELSQIDAKRYPSHLPSIVSKFGIDPKMNIRSEILSVQSITHELAQKAPQFESLFNAVPEFMGLNTPKRYLVLMANNYELRMSGGFNTYIAVVELSKGVPNITYSIDTYFIDEGDRMRSSALVNRNVPYFLSDYLYIQGRNRRLYARDATSADADFPTAANRLYTEFWKKDRSLPQAIDGIFQINNDVAVDLLRVLGPVNTSKFSVRTDQGTYITIPVTEFTADNVVQELENIAGGKLAQTIGRKEIIKFLANSLMEKAYTSEATNLLSVMNVMLDSLSRKDVMLYSFDPGVQMAFEGLGYGGRIDQTPDASWDYLHVNRSNFGAGKADWTQPGFVTQKVTKDIRVEGDKKISTVTVTISNPKRPSWYNIDPCCFYNAYLRVYAPKGSKLIKVSASDGQDPKGAEYTDELHNKTYFESFTRQLKETTLTITYEYELPSTINTDKYQILVQRQSGTSIDPYTIGVGGVSKEILLNADKKISFE